MAPRAVFTRIPLWLHGGELATANEVPRREDRADNGANHVRNSSKVPRAHFLEISLIAMGLEDVKTTFIPKARARRATAFPIFPSPTIPRMDLESSIPR